MQQIRADAMACLEPTLEKKSVYDNTLTMWEMHQVVMSSLQKMQGNAQIALGLEDQVLREISELKTSGTVGKSVLPFLSEFLYMTSFIVGSHMSTMARTNVIISSANAFLAMFTSYLQVLRGAEVVKSAAQAEACRFFATVFSYTRKVADSPARTATMVYKHHFLVQVLEYAMMPKAQVIAGALEDFRFLQERVAGDERGVEAAKKSEASEEEIADLKRQLAAASNQAKMVNQIQMNALSVQNQVENAFRNIKELTAERDQLRRVNESQIFELRSLEKTLADCDRGYKELQNQVRALRNDAQRRGNYGRSQSSGFFPRPSLQAQSSEPHFSDDEDSAVQKRSKGESRSNPPPRPSFASQPRFFADVLDFQDSETESEKSDSTWGKQPGNIIIPVNVGPLQGQEQRQEQQQQGGGASRLAGLPSAVAGGVGMLSNAVVGRVRNFGKMVNFGGGGAPSNNNAATAAGGSSAQVSAGAVLHGYSGAAPPAGFQRKRADGRGDNTLYEYIMQFPQIADAGWDMWWKENRDVLIAGIPDRMVEADRAYLREKAHVEQKYSYKDQGYWYFEYLFAFMGTDDEKRYKDSFIQEWDGGYVPDSFVYEDNKYFSSEDKHDPKDDLLTALAIPAYLKRGGQAVHVQIGGVADAVSLYDSDDNIVKYRSASSPNKILDYIRLFPKIANGSGEWDAFWRARCADLMEMYEIPDIAIPCVMKGNATKSKKLEGFQFFQWLVYVYGSAGEKKNINTTLEEITNYTPEGKARDKFFIDDEGNWIRDDIEAPKQLAR